jgi:hypothetical protein
MFTSGKSRALIIRYAVNFRLYDIRGILSGGFLRSIADSHTVGDYRNSSVFSMFFFSSFFFSIGGYSERLQENACNGDTANY